MDRRTVFFIALAGSLLLASGETAFAEKALMERELIREEYVPGVQEDLFYAHSSLDYSSVKIGPRRGKWKELRNMVAYLKDNIPAIYLEHAFHERFGVRDQTAEAGSYLRAGTGYVHGAVGFGGFGADRDFVHRFKAALEVEQNLAGTVNWRLGGRYLNYPEGDVYMLLPGVAWYYGDSYLIVEQGTSFDEGRDPAFFGMAKGLLAFEGPVGFYYAAAIGERTYDILPVSASKQFGYIFSGGVELDLAGGLKGRVGLSYAHEKPSFYKRGMNFSLSWRF